MNVSYMEEQRPCMGVYVTPWEWSTTDLVRHLHLVRAEPGSLGMHVISV